MEHSETIRTLIRDPKMEEARELIIEVAGIITRKNIDKLLSRKSIPDGVRKSLERIRKLMQKHAIPTVKDDKNFYKEIIQPAYMELIRMGG
jgi:hypothetical protein